MQRFELSANRHSIGGSTVIDIKANGRLCGTIYSTADGIKLVSQLLADPGTTDYPRVTLDTHERPPAMYISLTPPHQENKSDDAA
jgi:hypothetical protein